MIRGQIDLNFYPGRFASLIPFQDMVAAAGGVHPLWLQLASGLGMMREVCPTQEGGAAGSLPMIPRVPG
jgi:hypothetical protein